MTTHPFRERERTTRTPTATGLPFRTAWLALAGLGVAFCVLSVRVERQVVHCGINLQGVGEPPSWQLWPVEPLAIRPARDESARELGSTQGDFEVSGHQDPRYGYWSGLRLTAPGTCPDARISLEPWISFSTYRELAYYHVPEQLALHHDRTTDAYAVTGREAPDRPEAFVAAFRIEHRERHVLTTRSTLAHLLLVGLAGAFVAVGLFVATRRRRLARASVDSNTSTKADRAARHLRGARNALRITLIVAAVLAAVAGLHSITESIDSCGIS